MYNQNDPSLFRARTTGVA
eukprot:Gb_31665 [translate_table: standard]